MVSPVQGWAASIGRCAGLLVGDHQAVQADDRRAIAGELVVGVAEERQPVWMLPNAADDWLTSPKVISLANSRGACTIQGSGLMTWLTVVFQPVKPMRAAHVAAVVGDGVVEPAAQLHPFGAFAAVEADRLGGVAQAHQGVAEGGVEQLVAETQPNERAADPERDDGGDQHVDEHDPEHRLGQGEAQQRQRPGQVPQDRGERDHRDARDSTAPNSSTCRRAVGRGVGGLPAAGGEDVDVLLDALVGIVDGVVDEAPAVVGPVVQPVGGQAVGEPHSPPDDEPLHQIDVEQRTAPT